MRQLAIIGLFFLIGFQVSAEPEIKGTAPELAQFINGIPKTVAVAGEAEVRVPAHWAVLSLKVVTESKSLQEALRTNLELRGKVADYLKSLGIPGGGFKPRNFSFPPKSEFLGKRAKTFGLKTLFEFSGRKKKNFKNAAGAVDKWAEVQFDGVEFEYADKELQKQNAIAKACDNANDRKKIYEEKFSLKLVPLRFGQGEVRRGEAVPANYGLSRGEAYGVTLVSASGSDVAEESVSSFGELIYTATVMVEYSVQPK